MNILETINLWFAMNENGPATDERQLLNDAAEEIERLQAQLKRGTAHAAERISLVNEVHQLRDEVERITKRELDTEIELLSKVENAERLETVISLGQQRDRAMQERDEAREAARYYFNEATVIKRTDGDDEWAKLCPWLEDE